LSRFELGIIVECASPVSTGSAIEWRYQTTELVVVTRVSVTLLALPQFNWRFESLFCATG
jgi:hypothetical protein